MTIQIASTAKLSGAALKTSYPISISCWFAPVNASVSGTIFEQAGTTGGYGTGGKCGVSSTGAGNGADCFDRINGWGGGTAGRSGAGFSTSALKHITAVFTSSSSRTLYVQGTAAVTDTFSLPTGHIADHTLFEIFGFSTAAVQVAEAHVYSTALSAGDVTSLEGGTLAETIGGWLDGWTLQNFEAGGTYTSIGGSRTLTASGTISAGGLGHPVTRSSPSAFTGNVTLDGVSVAGTFSGTATTATLTSEPLRTNNGTLLASTSLAHVCIYNDTTGALVLRRTGISTNGSGVFTVTDAALTPATTYRLDWETAAGHRRMPRKAAT